MNVRKAMILASAASVLASMQLPPVQIEYLDKPKPEPDPKKRAKTKAARKQRSAK